MTVSDASLDESGSNFVIVAATSLLLGVTRTSSDAHAITTAISQGGSNPYCPKGYRTPNQREIAIMAYNKLYDGTEFNSSKGNMMSRTAFSFGYYGSKTVKDKYGYSVSIRLRTTCIIDSKLKATCSSWPKLGQVDPSWSVLPTCLAGVHGELHGCSRSRVSGAGHPPSIHVD